MKRIIVAALLTAVAGTAFAQQAVDPIGRYVIVQDGETPPAGFAPHVPSYEWKGGRFVRNGELYKSLNGGN
jgi:hypothetical protein